MRRKTNQGQLMATYGRLLLIVINTALLVASCFALWIGVRLVRSPVPSLASTPSDPVTSTAPGSSTTAARMLAQVNLFDIGVSVCAVSAAYIAMAVVGVAGGVAGTARVLAAYLVAVTACLALVVAVGVYLLVSVSRTRDAWIAVSDRDWAVLGDAGRDYIQQLYDCCGYAVGDGSAYTGISTPYFVSSHTNACAVAAVSNATTPGCYETATSHINTYSRSVGLAFVVACVALGGSVAAAWSARSRLMFLADNRRSRHM
ncbi:hypothetical protein BC831DRAFT_463474 [Entophlyctis helioformis]|nr:hypothetical protein BC831DRAFT_463474 [Entophlyctis helioformis]